MSETKIVKNPLVIALGSNLGNRWAYIYLARKAMDDFFGPALAHSSIYETKAWGITDQPGFLNAVSVYQNAFTASEALSFLRTLELKLGRKRHEKWGPRCIDLDILYAGDQVIQEEDLQIPHPHLAERSFVLVPLAEVLPDFKHPLSGKSSQSMLAEREDLDACKLYTTA